MKRQITFFSITLLTLGLAACGSDGGGGGTGGMNGSGGQGGSNGQGGQGAQGGGSGAVQCSGTMQFFPSFDKSCSAPADCVMQYHQVDCCGTLKAIGMNASEVAAFSAAEAECGMQYPACGCASGPTQTEDGKTVQDMSMILITCTNGACNTSAP